LPSLDSIAFILTIVLFASDNRALNLLNLRKMVDSVNFNSLAYTHILSFEPLLVESFSCLFFLYFQPTSKHQFELLQHYPFNFDDPNHLINTVLLFFFVPSNFNI